MKSSHALSRCVTLLPHRDSVSRKALALAALCLALLGSAPSLAGEPNGSLFGITLLQTIDTLKGNTVPAKGLVKIKGKTHRLYKVDVRHYPPFAQLTSVVVTAEVPSNRIVSIAGKATMDTSTCKSEARRLVQSAQKESGVAFEELEHQNDVFFTREDKSGALVIGCQVKRKATLQYQLSLSGY